MDAIGQKLDQLATGRGCDMFPGRYAASSGHGRWLCCWSQMNRESRKAGPLGCNKISRESDFFSGFLHVLAGPIDSLAQPQ